MNTHLPTVATREIDAGPFGSWLAQAHAALRGNGGMSVACGDCVGCCTSGYSILLRPHDAPALDLIPASLLSGVAHLAYPHLKMNPLTDGTCPMFKAGQCSIYAVRPQTCLDYDCRVFTATGMDAGADKPVINQRVKAWRFSYESDADRDAHHAVQSAAQFIARHQQSFPAGNRPSTPSGIAVLAIKSHGVFLNVALHAKTDAKIIDEIIHASRMFDAGQQQ